MSNSKKRVDYISWDEYFMGIALLTAMWRICPDVVPKTPIPRWEPALSVRITRLCLWDIMGSRRVAPMMSSRGDVSRKQTIRTAPNICM